MRIAITGTPGVGKTAAARLFSKQLGWKLIELNKLAEDRNLYIGVDRKRGSKIVDICGIKEELKKIKGNLIIESHYSHLIESDLVIVIRRQTSALIKEYKKRGWEKSKIEENIEAEIMEVCKQESLEKCPEVHEVFNDSIGDTVYEMLTIFFAFVLKSKGHIKLPKEMEKHFKKPYGKVFDFNKDLKSIKKEIGKHSLVISVGDESSYNLIINKIEPDVVILDNKVKRSKFRKKIPFSGRVVEVKNDPGTISYELWFGINGSFNNKTKIMVDGEEDLAVLPSVILAPLKTCLLYGQPDVGIVLISVDRNKRKSAMNLMIKIASNQV